MKYQKIPDKVSIHLRYLSQDKGLILPELVKRYPNYSRTSIYRHSRLPIEEDKVDSRHSNKGRPRKLSERDVRKLISSLHKLRKTYGNFASTDIQRDAGISQKDVSNRTIRQSLGKEGYAYSQCRRKGQLLKEDLKKRLSFASMCKKLPDNFWMDGISFYLDGKSWVHKTNPSEHTRTMRTRTWKKKGESLERNCTAKGKKEGSGGRVAKFMVAIAYGRGVLKCQQYTGNVNAELCANFVRDHFPGMFERSPNPKGKLFLQDGDPSQNSKEAKDAMDSIGCRLFKIPARSPDLNPIENIFHLVGKKLQKDALETNLVREDFEGFCRRVKKTCLEYPHEVIDNTIASMPKRIDLVIKSKGLRTKY